MSAPTLYWSRFNGVSDTIPKPKKGTFTDLAALLTAGTTAEKMDANGWNGATFKPGGTRQKSDVAEVFTLVIDLDNGPDKGEVVLPAVIEQALTDMGVSWATHPTHSDSPEFPRRRYVIPLVKPMPAAFWPTAVNWAMDYLGLLPYRHAMDLKAMRDPSRFWFFGPKAATSGGTFVRHASLLAIPIDELKPPRTASTTSGRSNVDGFAEAYVRGIPGESQGGRNNKLFQIVCYLRDYGVTEAVAMDAASEWASRCNPAMDSAEVQSTVSSVFQHATGIPGTRTQKTIENVELFEACSKFCSSTPLGSGTTEHGTMTAGPFIRLDVRELLNSPPPPLEWLVPGLLPLGMAGLLASPPGAGKSRVALDWCCRIAAGVPLMGQAPFSRQGVVFLSAEDGMESLQRRIHSVTDRLRAEGLTQAQESAMWRNLCLLLPDPRLGVLVLASRVSELVEAALGLPSPPALVVVDTFARVNGARDENSAAENAAVLNAMSMIQQATGASVLAITHVGKGAGENGSMALPQRLAMEAIRGSSAIIGAARFTVSLTLLNEAEATKAGLDIDRAAAGGYAVIALSKCNEAERGGWRLMERIPTGDPGAGLFRPMPDGDRHLALLRGGRTADQLKADEVFLVELGRIGGHLHSGGFNRLEVAKRVWPKNNNPENAANKCIGRLREKGLLIGDRLSEHGTARYRSLDGIQSGTPDEWFQGPEHELNQIVNMTNINNSLCVIPCAGNKLEQTGIFVSGDAVRI